jgi:hypothetical protein
MNIGRRIELMPAVSAPEKYPAQLIQGVFILPNGDMCSLRGSFATQSGWGKSNNGVSWGASRAPVKLNITWLSFAEAKYYSGTFDLPKKKIDSLLSEGFISATTKQKRDYTSIVAGMAPGGMCVVWLSGDYGNIIEVGRYQAEEIEMIPVSQYHPYSIWARNPDQSQAFTDYVKSTLEHLELTQYLEEHGVPYGLWDTYRERFSWRPKMVYEGPECTTDRIITSYYNGEVESLVRNRLRENPLLPRPRMTIISSRWSSVNLYKQIDIDFEEGEVFEIFQSFWEDIPSIKAELQVMINETNDGCRVLLVSCDESVHKRIEFKRCKFQIRTLDERSIRTFEVTLDKKES